MGLDCLAWDGLLTFYKYDLSEKESENKPLNQTEPNPINRDGNSRSGEEATAAANRINNDDDGGGELLGENGGGEARRGIEAVLHPTHP